MQTYFFNLNSDFICKHCGAYVSTQQAVSGVVNRNHCPYCLYSRHVDLFKAGDRLCACKGMMMPIGLSFKKSRDKYACKQQGELMLVHYCEVCGDLSINRIAADDDPLQVLAIFEWKPSGFHHLSQVCQERDIALLQAHDRLTVQSVLFGESEHSDKEPIGVC